MLNQAKRNWQRYHWVACRSIPSSAREEFKRLTSGKRPQSSKTGQEYWIRRSGEMGVVDTATMTRTAASSPDYTSVDSSTENEWTIDDHHRQRRNATVRPAGRAQFNKCRDLLTCSPAWLGSWPVSRLHLLPDLSWTAICYY